MFTVTALGHQGWLIRTPRTRVLIDPVLTPHFTRMPLTKPAVHPPRRIDLAAFPPIDAVLITHEHPDHLDFVTLQHLPRGTPVLLSSHASDAARRVIASMGHEVGSLAPGRPCLVGELAVLPLPPYVIGEPGENEVDIVPLLVRDHAGHGNFFTSVDIVQVPEMAQEVRRHLDRPGVWTHANNAFDASSCFEWVTPRPDPVGEAASILAKRYVSLFDGWGHPAITLVNGDGLTLGGGLARMNPHVFPVDGAALVERLGTTLPGHAFAAVKPGTTARMVDGVLAGLTEGEPFLSTDDALPWPAKGGERPASRIDFPPGTGRTSLRPGDQARLVTALAELGRFLFARATYRGIYRLMAERDHPPSMEQTLALVLRDGDGAQVWAYCPTRCGWERVTCADPRARFVAGAELWASDVLAALTFEAFADDLFHFGRKRLWNAAPGVFRCDLDTEIQLFAHPLRAPDEVEALYRTCLDPSVGPSVPPLASDRPVFAEMPHPPRRRPVARPVPPSLLLPPLDGFRAPSGGAGPAPLVDEATQQSLADAVARATRGAWSVAPAVRRGSAMRVVMTAPGAPEIELDVTPREGTQKYYRQVGALAFTYRPRDLPEGALGLLDGVIDAIAAGLEEE